MSYKLIIPPAVEPITLAEARDHLRLDADNTALDAQIAIWITAAREACEHEIHRALITQTWELVLDEFPCGALRLTLPPLQSILSVKYLDPAGTETTLAPSEYSMDKDTEPGFVVPSLAAGAWPSTQGTINAVRVQFRVGYGDTSAAVPRSLIEWMKLHLGIAYCNMGALVGGAVNELPGRFWDSLLDRYRFYGQ